MKEPFYYVLQIRQPGGSWRDHEDNVIFNGNLAACTKAFYADKTKLDIRIVLREDDQIIANVNRR